MPKKMLDENREKTHQTLYRKYRPSSFAEIVGQDRIVTVLEALIKKGTIPHAYLFTGPRGTGKTSLARIFAKGLGASDRDIYEIDAASNRKIDEMRELRESVTSLPFESPYKVYIIDEVHMLTKDSFNAFLKTLEEPPQHAIFILATTEYDKVPETILSRCQVFSFERPSQSILREVVMNVAKKEGYDLDPASADIIAMLGNGSFRDTLGVLQKVLIASSTKNISESDVVSVTGAPPHALAHELLAGIRDGDKSAGARVIMSLEKGGYSVPLFLSLLMERVRAILLLRFDKASAKTLSQALGEDEVNRLIGFTGSPKITSQTLLVLLEEESRIHRTNAPLAVLALAVARMFGE